MVHAIVLTSPSLPLRVSTTIITDSRVLGVVIILSVIHGVRLFCYLIDKFLFSIDYPLA